MTQLQPVYARYVFPCLDEPDLKVGGGGDTTHKSLYNLVCSMSSLVQATFSIEVGRPSAGNTTVLSNMPALSTRQRRREIEWLGSNGDDLVWDTFERTRLPMSPYLVAVVVANYESRETRTNKHEGQVG